MRMEGESWEMLVNDFARTGRTLFKAGLNNSHSGNMSVRVDDSVVISRRGAMLAELTSQDLIAVGLNESGDGIALASREVDVHRAIYRATPSLAVVHTHPRSATALSLRDGDIVPVDAEGRYYFKIIPVLPAAQGIGSKEVEEKLPPLLRDFPVVIVKGHGAFAVGKNLEEGLQVSHALEWSCDILLRCEAPRVSPDGLVRKNQRGK